MSTCLVCALCSPHNTAVDAFSPLRQHITHTRITRTCTSTGRVSLNLSDYSKWDNLVDEDDDEDGFDESRVPADMKYILPNIKRQSDTFEALSTMDDANLIADVWLQSPSSSVAWYVGSVARISDVSAEHAIDRQYPLIERHAWALQPVELHPARGPFVVYVAPGNSREAVVGGRDASIRLSRVEEEAVRRDGGGANIRAIGVGFRGAGYDSADEDAYRVDMTTWEEEDEAEADASSAMLDDEIKDFAIPATAEDDADMQAKADKLLEKDIDKFFDDEDFSSFMDSAFPKDNNGE